MLTANAGLRWRSGGGRPPDGRGGHVGGRGAAAGALPVGAVVTGGWARSGRGQAVGGDGGSIGRWRGRMGGGGMAGGGRR